MTLKGYIAYHKTGTINDMDKAHGGVSIFIKDNLPQSRVDVSSPLQTIVVKVTLYSTVTLRYMYIPPSTALRHNDLTHISDQLPNPFVIFGDFNAHNYLWYGSKTDTKGKVMETFMTKTEWPLCANVPLSIHLLIY